jgi:hypothetical protein
MPRFVARLLVPLLFGLMAVSVVGLPLAAQTALDPTRIRIVDRLKFTPPATLSLGTLFDVEIGFPKSGVLGVGMRQLDAQRRFDHMEHLPIVLDRNGRTVAKVTPLAIEAVHFIINAGFLDSGLSALDFTVQVGPPTAPPYAVLGDLDFINIGHTTRYLKVGDTDRKLDPVAFFDSAPGHEVPVRGWATYRLLPSDGPPVVTLTADGTLSALRLGTAMAEVSFAGAISQFPIRVIQ